MNLDKLISQLEARQAAERKTLLSEMEIRKLLPEEFDQEQWFVHVHHLYGTKGTLKRQISYDTPAASPAELINIYRLLPPIPAELVSIRGCKTIWPVSYGQNNDETYEHLTPVEGFWIQWDPNGYSDGAEVTWYSKIGEDLWRVEVPLAARKLFHSFWRRLETFGRTYYEAVRQPANLMCAEFSASQINWSRPSDDCKGSSTFYWTKDSRFPKMPEGLPVGYVSASEARLYLIKHMLEN